jgi:SNF2 family DNA or RNA helicase
MLLFDYQQYGVDWMVGRETAPAGPKGGFLCDEMGLGKTVQLIATMLRNPVGRTLVCVPKSIVAQWKSEVETFAPNLEVYVFDGPKRAVPSDDFEGLAIAPYSVVADLENTHWDRIILDEGHEIRNPKSKLCKCLCTFDAQIRWVVSGTPIFNSMRDFVTLCSFLGISQGTVTREYESIRAHYVLRRTKADISTGTTPLSFENLELDMYPEERELYKEAFLAGQGFIREHHGRPVNAMEILECLLRIRQVMTWPQLYLDGMATKHETETDVYTGRSRKHEMLMDLIASHPDEKSLVFTQFTGETDRLQELLTRRDVPVYRLDGHVDSGERLRRIDAFRVAPPNAVFLIQIRAGGVGLNLQEASRVYITAPSWNPATELQAIGRAHRTGQKRAVIVKKLIYKDVSDELPSVDESIVNLQVAKSQVCADVLKDTKLLKQVPGVTSMKLRTIAKMFKARL